MARFEIDTDRAFQFPLRASSTSNMKMRDSPGVVMAEANARLSGES